MTSYCTQNTKVVTKNDCCSPSMRNDKYYVTISVADTWIMPAVNAQTILQIPNCNNLLPGSWLWNGNVGYLRIDSYNSASGEVKVTNIGYTGNAAPDTVFPSCMDFVVTAPILVDEISDNITCLTSDFVSPAVGNCALMTVKSTANLRKDYIIAIDIYQYQVSEVMDNTTVKVCNYGLGKVGVIDAPCDGSCLPIRVINAESPCLQDAVNEANGLVSCVGGEARVFVGLEEGQSAYWSNAEGSWKLINSNIEADCTVTTNTVNLIAGNVGPYLLNVVTTAPFKVGDRLTFNDEHDAYVVSEIVNDLQLRVIKNDAPTEDTIIDAETRLCIVDCCDWIPEYVDSLANRLDSVENLLADHTQQISQINDDIEDLQLNKADQISPASLLSGSSIVTITNGVNVILDNDATISVDNDLSQYDNTNKHFVVDGANISTTTGAVGVFAGHTDDNTTGDRTLNFKSIRSSDNNILVSEQGNDIVITNNFTPSPTVYSMANVGTGEGQIYKSGSNPFNVRTLKKGTGIDIVTSGDEITISNSSTTSISSMNVKTVISNSDINLVKNSKTTALTGQVTIPTSHTGGVTIVGTAVITVRGVAYNDTHYAPTTGSSYSFVANAKNCRITTTADLSILGNTLVNDVTFDEEYFFIPSPNDPISAPNPTKQSQGRFTQIVTLPFAVTLASLASGTTIDLPIEIECPSATATHSPETDEAIWAKIKNVAAFVSALIYKL